MRYDDLCDPEQAFLARTMPARGEEDSPPVERCRHCGEPYEICDCPTTCEWCGELSDDLTEIEGDFICAACRAEDGRA